MPDRTEREGAHRPPSLDALAAQANARIREGRVANAASIVDRMQSHLDGAIPPTPLTTTEIRDKLLALYPHDDEQDVLPARAADPEGIIITASQVEQTIGSLNRRSCHGSSAWTNVAICRLMKPLLDHQDTSVI